jgi:hypothetical protein
MAKEIENEDKFWFTQEELKEAIKEKEQPK